MALCTKCLPLQTIALAEIKAPEKGLQHHETYASLKDAALNGCQLCVMFRQALLHAHELQFSWSEDEAEASYTEWDRQVGNIFKIMGVYRAFYGKSSQSDCHALQIIRPHQPHVVEKETGFSVSLWWPLLRLTTAAESVMDAENVTRKDMKPLADFEFAKSWLRDCSLNHARCGPVVKHTLPTRVIEIGDDPAFRTLRLKETHGLEGFYATLSHRWGASEPILRDEATLRQFLRSLDFALLPQTFRDAIIAARELEIPYLWIDSMCIIQTGVTDWQKECGRMAEYYSGAALTIACPSVNNADSGFIMPRKQPQSIAISRENARTGVLSEWRIRDDCDPDYWSSTSIQEAQKNSTIARRAWILQERLLSTRLLYFGSERMFWECATSCRFEDAHYEVVVADYDDQSRFSPALLRRSQAGTTTVIGKDWYHVVEAFCLCQLTVESDKLLAIGGLAAEFQRRSCSRYFAGLWEVEFIKGLCWYVDAHFSPYAKHTDYPAKYRAPSWSWAALKHAILYDVDVLDDRSLATWLIDVTKVETDLVEASNPTGSVCSATMKCKAKLKMGLARVMVSDESQLYLYDPQEPYDRLAEYMPDSAATWKLRDLSKYERQCLCLLLGKGKGLVVEEVESRKGVFRRVGFLRSIIRGERLENWFEDVEFSRVELI